MGEYVELLVYGLILLLPVIGRILSAMGGNKAETPGAEPRPRPVPRPRRTSAEKEGAERWKELLRGEAEPVVEDPLPPARQQRVEPDPRPVPEPRPEPRPVPQPRPVREPMTLDPLPRPVLERVPGPVRAPAPSLTQAPRSRIRAPAVTGLGADFVADLGAGLQDLKTELRASAAIGEALSPDDEGESRFEGRLAFPRSPEDWRRAIVLQEVLGPPLALREAARPGDLPSFTLV